MSKFEVDIVVDGIAKLMKLATKLYVVVRETHINTPQAANPKLQKIDSLTVDCSPQC
jgi:hypothetical protein